MTDLVEPWADDDDDGDGRPAQEDAAAFLNRVFFDPIGLHLEGARRIGEQRSRWLVDLRNVRTGELHERISLGRTCDLRHEQLRDAILEATGAVLLRKGFGVVKWDKFRAALHEAAVLERTGGDDEQTREWLADFIEARRWTDRATDVVEMSDARKLAVVLGAKPECFIGSNGAVYVRLSDLVKYITHVAAARTTNDDLRLRLYALGFERDQVSARVDDKVTKGRYFRSEPGFDPDA